MLNHDPTTRQLPVALFLLVAQFRLTRLLVRRPALFVQLLQALIAAVAEHLQALMWLDFAPPVKGEVMHRAASMRCADDLAGAPVDNNLTFQRVPLLLAAVVSFLLFFGRSTGVSATSTTTNSISWSAG